MTTLFLSVTLLAAVQPKLGALPATPILEREGLRFKDLDRNGELTPYEDWRLTPEERAADLAGRLSVDELLGLTLHSSHQEISKDGVSPLQETLVTSNHMRHFLVRSVPSVVGAVTWHNAMQALCERERWGIPMNNSSDPRHQTASNDECNAGGGKISRWPGYLGFAATRDLSLVRRFAEISADEHRHLGIPTSMAIQIDIASEPRWWRTKQTFGEDADFITGVARELCDGYQTDPDSPSGWGPKSVVCIVKHWPGGGPVKQGRDPHCGFGRWAAFPGDNLAEHKRPFVEGAFKLNGPTRRAAALMPYYYIASGQTDEEVGCAFNRDLIERQLRRDCRYDGVVVTDWGITRDASHEGYSNGKPWGVEGLSVAQRHLRVLEAGCDQFGGNDDIEPAREAYRLGVRKYGEEQMLARLRVTARRVLLNEFRLGLFENPYVDVAEAERTVGCEAYVKAGFEAQVRSVTLLKNAKGALPLALKTKVYVPARIQPAQRNFWEYWVNEKKIDPIPEATLAKYFTRVATPEEAEAALVFLDEPATGWGYDRYAPVEGMESRYRPISLLYRDAVNAEQIRLLEETRRRMPGKPVVGIVNLRKPFVPGEVEPLVDALVVTFDVSSRAVLEIVSGAAQPSGRLPFQLPANMATVERQCEDVPQDMLPYRDACGGVYDLGFGLMGFKTEAPSASHEPVVTDVTRPSNWFWWMKHVAGAAGRTLEFTFPNDFDHPHKYCVGPKGPAASFDRGRTWRYLFPEGHADHHRFTYAFGADENDALFAFSIPYGLSDWPYPTKTLRLSREGRPVPYLHFGNVASPRRRFYFTARHHACETTASFVLEGLVGALLTNDWVKANAEVYVMPFMDVDGVARLEQGKGRLPHDHNRDYTPPVLLYPETRAFIDLFQVPEERPVPKYLIDFHDPLAGGDYHDHPFAYSPKSLVEGREWKRFLELTDFPWKPSYSTMTATSWFAREVAEARLSVSLETPYAFLPDEARTLGAKLARVLVTIAEKE